MIISLVSPFRKSEWRRLITWVIFSAQRLGFLGNIHRVPTAIALSLEKNNIPPAAEGGGDELLKGNITRQETAKADRLAQRELAIEKSANADFATCKKQHSYLFEKY